MRVPAGIFNLIFRTQPGFLILEAVPACRYTVRVNKTELLRHLERLDGALQAETTLCVYGSAAFILLDEPDRTSLDIDVAGPYSTADFGDLQRAAAAVGLPVNPDETTAGDHIEWISAARLCLPRPNPATDIALWQGRRLRVHTVAFPQLIASKLIRYDPIDQADIQYLCAQGRVEFASIADAARQLPPPFDSDRLVRENLENLRRDLQMWRGTPP
jgi:hypothetical protein